MKLPWNTSREEKKHLYKLALSKLKARNEKLGLLKWAYWIVFIQAAIALIYALASLVLGLYDSVLATVNLFGGLILAICGYFIYKRKFWAIMVVSMLALLDIVTILGGNSSIPSGVSVPILIERLIIFGLTQMLLQEFFLERKIKKLDSAK